MSDRTVIITGGARGIGLAISEQVVAAGHRAVIWDMDVDGLAAATGKFGDAMRAAQVDISSQASIDAAIVTLTGEWRPTHLVNNAGILGAKMALNEMRVEEIDSVLSVNIRGLFCVTSAFLNNRRDSGDAAIVNIASIAGMNGGAPGNAVYGATKGAVLAITRAMARDLAPAIRVNALAPGIIDTDMQKGVFASEDHMRQTAASIPQKRLGTPRDVADAACWLLFNAAYTTGETIRVAGGRI